MFASNCHLVLGLVAIEGSTSGRVMSSLGITVDWAREGLQHGQDAVNSPVQRADVELEPGTRATLTAADAAASRAGGLLDDVAILDDVLACAALCMCCRTVCSLARVIWAPHGSLRRHFA